MQQNNLTDIIKSHIRQHGPMTVETYWNLCLAHPVHGYYLKKDPLGVDGDFTTAPEISQLFGEMIGIWVAMQLSRLANPPKVHLVEFGPGRGTLMADILRTIGMMPVQLNSLSIHLIETSPTLRAKQAQLLSQYNVSFHDDISKIPHDAPVLMIGNEFLDALPIRQFAFMDGRWSERVIGLSAQGELMWGLRVEHDAFSQGLESVSDGIQGAVFEFSAARANVFQQMVVRAADQGGAVLMIDYGHDNQSGVGDTFQAVFKHNFVDVLSHSGDADLTSHVNFGVLHHIAKSYKTEMAVRLDSQRQFLCAMGIEGRAAQLSKNAKAQQKIDLSLALSRLIDENKMGQLFRVIEVCDEKTYS